MKATTAAFTVDPKNRFKELAGHLRSIKSIIVTPKKENSDVSVVMNSQAGTTLLGLCLHW